MVRLTYDDLAAKGVPLDTTDIATFAMTYLGQPVDIQVQDANNNQRLDPGELVIFYAEAYSGRYNTNNVYFFTYGGAPGARMASRDVTPTGAEPVVTSIIRTARVEKDSAYYSELPHPGDRGSLLRRPASVWTRRRATRNPVSTLT